MVRSRPGLLTAFAAFIAAAPVPALAGDGEQPEGCNANSVGVALIPRIAEVPVPPGTCVLPGQAIDYLASAFVSENDPAKPMVIFCDVIGGQIAVTLPDFTALPLRDGQYVPTAGHPDTPDVPQIGNSDGAGVIFTVDVPQAYIVDAAHVDGAGFLNARVDYGQTDYLDMIGQTQDNAIVLTEPVEEGTATVSNSLPICLPSIDLVKSVDPAVVCIGVPTEVTYTFEVTNTSSTPSGLGFIPDLTSVSLIDSGCETIEGPFGDDGDGLLNAGETWTYTCTRTVSGDVVNDATVSALAVAEFPEGQVIEGVVYEDDATATVEGIECTGACCFDDGSCEDLTQDECIAAGGLPQGVGVPCDEADCADVKGACCLGDGACAVVTAEACAETGGVYEGDQTICSPNPCPPPTGACCAIDGTCTIESQADCEMLGSLYQGNDTTCEEVACSQPTGACCLPSGACAVLDLQSCDAQGGTYQGDFTSCGQTQCPQPVGACCFVDGSCANLTHEECNASSGLWQGAQTSCDTTDCPQPPGACCFEDGTCTQVTEARCDTDGGIYQGDLALCVPSPCPQPIGACCFSDGTCEELTQEACRLAGASTNGLVLQDGVLFVEPVFGSYRVLKDVTVCVDPECGFPGGSDPCDPFPDDGLLTYTYRLTNEPTSENAIIGWVLEAAAGSIVDAGFLAGDGIEPGEVIITNDTTVEWRFFGDPIDPGEQSVELYVTSAFGPGAVDTTILGDFALDTPGTCFGPAVEGDFCRGAIWQGPGTSCADGLCTPASGACCLPGGACDTLGPNECLAAGGDYQGDGAVCAPGMCPTLPGACCFVDGTCEVLAADDCQEASGLFQGAGTTCEDDLCLPPIGGCCFENGACSQVTEDRCATDGGVYQGDFTLCVPNPCPQPTGACCFDDGTCEVLTQEACRLAGASPNGLLVQDSVIIVEPVFGSYRVTKDMRACIDADCGFPGGSDPCDPFPDDGLITYTYRLSNSGDSANAVIGWIVDTGIAGAIVDAGFLPGPGIEPSDILVTNDGATVQWQFFDDPIDPGEASVELYIVSALGPAAVDVNALGDFALDSPGACFGPAVDGDFCRGAIWQGPGTTCDPNPCAAPQGACCLPSGVCDTLTADECAAQGGEYQGNYVVCEPGLCPEPPGACCLVDGTCQFLTQTECQQIGLFQGAGTSCEEASCPQPVGACCFPNGACTQVTEARCATDGGVYQGDFILCVPNPCPQPTGACCFDDGTCEVLTQEDCRLAGASADGLLVQDSVIIVEPVFGSYRVTKDMRACIDADCGFPGGSDPCDPFPDDGLITYTYRLSNSGDSANAVIGWIVDTGIAGAIVDAGFLPGPGIEPSDILVTNGDSSVQWQFFDDPLDPGEASVELYIVSALGPAAVDVNALGDFALDSPGACFGPAVDGDFCRGALWQGPGTTCDPNPCAAPQGACCLPSGFCDTLTADECADLGGVYQGDFVVCEPGLCPEPPGACCLVDGTCQILTQTECQQIGLFQGAGTSCDDDPCPQPVGACCFPNGTCTQVTEARCATDGGVYQGDFILCVPNPCPQPTGACCFDDGTCEVLTQEACRLAGASADGLLVQDSVIIVEPVFGSYRVTKDMRACIDADCGFPGGSDPCDPFPDDGLVTYTYRLSNSGDSANAVIGWIVDTGIAGAIVDAGFLPGPGIEPSDILVTNGDSSVQWQFFDDPLDPGEASVELYIVSALGPAAVDVNALGDFALDSPGVCFGPAIDGDFCRGAIWQGPGTSCDDGLCAPPTGACCLPTGFCSTLTLEECAAAGGDYQGDFVVCVPGLCPQPDGACCLEDGTCEALTFEECLEAGGLFQGDGTSCDTSDCPQPIGACCFTNGFCSVKTEEACTTQGGIYQGDMTICAPDVCDQPTGACCFADGSCEVSSLDECISAGGIYQGDDTVCEEGTCPPPNGACCYPDGNCTTKTEEACTTQGGIYQGDGTTCTDDLCDQPTGACCFDDGSCLESTQEACFDAGGIYQGNFTDCDPNDCPQPNGACCFPNGSCTTVTEERCAGDGGVFQGDGVVCIPNPCPGPPGACCFDDGTCEILTQQECRDAGVGAGGLLADGSTIFEEQVFGTYTAVKTVRACVDADCTIQSGGMGSGNTACDPFPDDGLITYVYTIENLPESMNSIIGWLIDTGVPGSIVEAGWLRSGGVVPSEAFVSKDGGKAEFHFFDTLIEPGQTSDELYVISALGPAAVDSTILGDFALDSIGLCLGPAVEGDFCRDTIFQGPGTECDLCVGACCLPDGSCIIATLEECGAAGGEYQGLFTDCNVECPQGVGACCLPSGDCIGDVTADECESDLGGTFQGVDTTCADVDCPPPPGACCLPDGSCLDDLTQAECQALGGQFQGEGTICSDDLCPQPRGACCFPNGSCTFVTPNQCDADGGTHQGLGTSCDPNLCPPPTGACCLPDGSCLDDVTQATCMSQDGIWLGPDTVCGDMECPGGGGACCLTSGECLDALTEEACLDMGGDFQGDGVSCDEVTCVPSGACCLDDGSCVAATQLDCFDLNGLYQGDGTSCADAECVARGACCLFDGTCIDGTSPDECELDLGGVFQGPGSVCTPETCPVFGDSCCEFGKPRRLTFLYTGDDCSATSTMQDPGKVDCDDFGVQPQTVRIIANDDDDPDNVDHVWFDGVVTLGETFILDAANGGEDKLKSATWIHVLDLDGELLQSVEFHTSCSQPLETGDQYGAHLLIDCEGEDEPIEGDCCAGGDKPRALIMLYTGEDCSATSHMQDPGKVSCDEFGPLPDTVFIIANDSDDPDNTDNVWFTGTVALGDTYQIDAANGGEDKLKSETHVHIFDSEGGTLLQTVEFHTSCSQPLVEGNQFGASLLVGCIGENKPVEGDCCDGDDKPRALQFQYTGDGCDATNHMQDPDKVFCAGDPDDAPMVVIVANNDNDPFDGHVWFFGDVALGDVFELNAAAAGQDHFSSNTWLHIFLPDNPASPVQSIKFHTSCSQPLAVGNQFGSALLIGCTSQNEGSCCEDGKPRALIMEYTAADCSATMHSQDPGKVSCTDFGPLPDTVHIIANDDEDPDDDGNVWFDGMVSTGGTYAIDAGNAGENDLSSATFIHIFDAGGTLLQTVEFHTSCSQPLFVGNQFGGSIILDCIGSYAAASASGAPTTSLSQ